MTVAEACDALREQYNKTRTYDASLLRLVLGDPCKGVSSDMTLEEWLD